LRVGNADECQGREEKVFLSSGIISGRDLKKAASDLRLRSGQEAATTTLEKLRAVSGVRLADGEGRRAPPPPGETGVATYCFFRKAVRSSHSAKRSISDGWGFVLVHAKTGPPLGAPPPPPPPLHLEFRMFFALAPFCVERDAVGARPRLSSWRQREHGGASADRWSLSAGRGGVDWSDERGPPLLAYERRSAAKVLRGETMLPHAVRERCSNGSVIAHDGRLRVHGNGSKDNLTTAL